nr:PIG-L deacetylase family protein [Longimycelium tulufanense]
MTSVERLLLLGAHCDDIAIGAGGTLLTLAAANPGMRVRAVVFTGAGTERAEEEQSALRAFCPDAQVDVTVLGLPDGLLPERWGEVKRTLREVRAAFDPDLVLASPTHDAHQDHRTIARLVPTEFRNHLILGFEIPKWDGDMRQPGVFVPLSDEAAHDKCTLLHKHYPSQHGRDWFDDETFLGLARLRGMQCRSRYAEAFFADKLVLRPDDRAEEG